MLQINVKLNGDYMGRKKRRISDNEITSLNPGQINKKIPNNLDISNLNKIIWFFVINTLCTDVSANGKTIEEYGWKKDVWKKQQLKKTLYSVCELKKEKSLYIAQNYRDMKNACEVCELKKNFHKLSKTERIACVKMNKYNEVLSIFYHIRNALAHGRIAISRDNTNNIYYFLEDGKKKGENFFVSARIVLKEKTLLKWIEIIEDGERKIS